MRARPEVAVEVYDAESPAGRSFAGQPTPRPISASRLPLDSLEACRRELARVYREVRAGLLPAQQGTRLTYMLGELGKLLALSKLETRIEALEAIGGDAMAPHEGDEDVES